jgi:hypothetical protein
VRALIAATSVGTVNHAPTPPTGAPSATYRERQRVPLSWSAGLLLLACSLVVAVWAFLGTAWGLGSLVVVVLLTVGGLYVWGRSVVRVGEGRLQVGGATIDTRWLGPASALTVAQTKSALREGRPDEWLHLRPWLSRSVRIALVDPADRHRTWLVATRRPEELARALNDQLTGGADHV